jgi:hypothetical protein
MRQTTVASAIFQTQGEEIRVLGLAVRSLEEVESLYDCE